MCTVQKYEVLPLWQPGRAEEKEGKVWQPGREEEKEGKVWRPGRAEEKESKSDKRPISPGS